MSEISRPTTLVAKCSSHPPNAALRHVDDLAALLDDHHATVIKI